MQVKIIFFVTVILLFLTVVFLDQNSNPVPLKVVIGNPYHVGLSAIILVSVLTGILLTIAVLFLFKRSRKKSLLSEDQ